MTSNFEELVGRTIASISIDTQSEHYLSFATDEGPANSAPPNSPDKHTETTT